MSRTLLREPVEMYGNRRGRARFVTRHDGVQYLGVLADQKLHAAGLRQGQHAIAIELHFDLHRQLPDIGVAGDVGDDGVEILVGGMKTQAVVAAYESLLFVQVPAQAVDLIVGGVLGGEPDRHVLERLAHHDGFGQGGDRDAGHEGARLRKNLDQTVGRKTQQGLAHRRPAHAVRERRRPSR